MKILYIHDLLEFGGINKVSSCKENYLSEHGFEIVNLCMADQKGTTSYYPYNKEIRLISLFSEDYDRWLRYPVVGRLLRFLIFRIHFLKAIRSVRPDIIVTTRDYIEPFSVILLTFRIKRVLEFHGALQDDDLRNLSWRSKLRMRFKYPFYTLVALTKEDKEKRESCTGYAFHTIYNPLSIEGSHKSALVEKKVVSLGRFHEQKGYDLLIPAWKRIAEAYPDWTLHLYGTGSQETLLRDLIRENKLQNHVFLHAPVKDVREVLLASSIFLLPSRYEGFGLVLTESMACGVPCIAFSCSSGPAEIIEDGKDGFLVPHLAIDRLIDKTMLLIEDGSLRAELGEHASKSVLRFSIHTIMKEWINLFNTLHHE